MTPPEILGTPAGATWVAICIPFMARYFVAWTVFQRVRGWWPGANIAPYKLQSDYPSPNSWRLELARFCVVGVVALLPAFLVSAVAGDLPSLIWPTVVVGSMGASLIWAFRRIRADDRRSLKLLGRRLRGEPSGDIDAR